MPMTPKEANSRFGEIECAMRESGGGFIHHRGLGAILGHNEAAIFGELLSAAYYWEKQHRLEPDGSFFMTVENMKEATGIGIHPQGNAIKRLVELDLIRMEVRDRKRYFTINRNPCNFQKLCPPILKKKTHGTSHS